MILIDANLLLYAYDSSSEYHKNAKDWFQEVLSQPEPVRLAWMTILAFLRIATNPRAFTRPLSINEALAVVSDWLSIPSVRILNPTERHLEIMNTLLPAAQVSGPLVMDGHLAALAIEHGATLYTNDKDFARFSGVRLRNPLQ